MLTRVLAGLMCLVGAVLIALAIASATIWRASDTLVATAEAEAGSTMIVTEPGVLDLAADEVTLEATGPGEGVVIALGRSSDVEAWVGADPHTVVTGLADLKSLSTRTGTPPDDAAGPTPEPTGTATEEPTDDPTAGDDEAPADEAPADEDDVVAADPAGSDLWLAEEVGTTSARMAWTAEPGRWSVLVASTGAGAGPPTLTMTWPQEVTTPWLVPGVAAGAVLLLAGLVLLALVTVRGRRTAAVAARRPAATSSTGAPLSPVASGAGSASLASAAGTSAVPVRGEPQRVGAPGAPLAPGASSSAPGAPLTRRQMRELERGGTGQLPVVGQGTPDGTPAQASGPAAPPQERTGSPVPGASPAPHSPRQSPQPPQSSQSPGGASSPPAAPTRGVVPGAPGGAAPPGAPRQPEQGPAVTRSATGHVPRHGLPETEAPSGLTEPSTRPGAAPRHGGHGQDVHGPVAPGRQAGPAGSDVGATPPERGTIPPVRTPDRAAATEQPVRTPDGAAGTEQPVRPPDGTGPQQPRAARLAARFTRRGPRDATPTQHDAPPATPTAPSLPPPPPAEPIWTPRPGQQGPGASADAWRRAWGFADAGGATPTGTEPAAGPGAPASGTAPGAGGPHTDGRPDRRSDEAAGTDESGEGR